MPAPKRLLYNAKFSGPKGNLNPMGLKVPGLIAVQLFPKTAIKWIILNPDTKGQLSPITFFSPDQAMGQLSAIFEKQETEWVILNMDGTPHEIPEEPPLAAHSPQLYK